VRVERLVRCESEGETEALGEAVGELLECGDLIELRGELGAGKTCWVRGLARGLGVGEPVRSPTFTICHVHRGRVLLFHLDAYRLEDPGELLEQGWDEMPARGAVAIEWGDRAAALLPPDRLVVAIEHAPGARLIRLRALGGRSERLLAAVDERGDVARSDLARSALARSALSRSALAAGAESDGDAGEAGPGRRRHDGKTEEKP